MYLDGKRIFLAGATGLAGTSVLNDILGQYPNTKIRASYYEHTRPFIQNDRVDYVFCDLKSLEDCRRAVKGCDGAIMAAAFSAGAGVLSAARREFAVDNVLINSRLLEAFFLEQVKRIVYVGSAVLYQECGGHIREDELDFTKDPHPAHFGLGWMVRFVEKLCRFWHDRYGMEILIARTANIFGPYAKFDPGGSNFIPAIIRKAVDRIDPFEVWGNPDVTRDVIYAEDFGRAIALMMACDPIKFDVFNIGSGVQTRVGDVVDWALKYAGHRPAKIQYQSDKPVTTPFRALDCSKAKNLLGWETQYKVEEGIEKTTRWWIENKEWWKK